MRAEHGDAHAQSDLGNLYRKGLGTPQDYAEALSWYRKAADKGDAHAQYGLGFMYRNGQGVPQDNAEALSWYRKAADKGDANAQYALGFMYCTGQGVPQDYGEAVSWYRRAADQGSVEAQYSLGIVYRDGDGVPRDYAEAVRWYRKAAGQGDKKARRALFSMYCAGRGTPLVRWTSITVVFFALPVIFVPQRRWRRAQWVPMALCSAICAMLTVHELSLSALSSALFALVPLGPPWRGVGRVLWIALLGGGSAIYAFGAVRAVHGSEGGGDQGQRPSPPPSTT